MIFGNKKQFAIECILEEGIKNLESIFGYIVIWIKDEKLGQSDLLVDLKIPSLSFQQSLDSCDTRKNDEFKNLDTSEIFCLLESTLWGEPEESNSFTDLIEASQKYDKFNICSNFSESFDGESLYLIEYKKKERFIWKTFNSEKIKEINLPLGSYEKVVESFLNWINSKMQSNRNS